MNVKRAAIWLVLTLVIVCCAKSKKGNSRIKYITSPLALPHAAPNNKLIVDDMRFEWVRGKEPFHVDVPELTSILFITDHRKDHSVTIHLYDLNARIDRKIHTSSTLFGHGIGGTNRLDTVRVISADQVELVTKFTTSISTMRLNFRTGVVELDKFERLDKKASHESTPDN